MAGSIFIPLVSVFNNKGISEAKSGLASISGIVKNLKGAAVATAASMASIAAVDFVKEAVNSARDLQSSYVGLNGLFGELGPMMTQYTKDAEAIGLSQLEASRSVTFLGSALGATGLPMGDVADKTKNLIGIASDLAATFGLPLQEALTGIGATFRGEYDPIERFGVAIKQAQVNALLAARGQKGLTGQMLASAQAQARYDLLLRATIKTQGNYAAQQDSLYVKQQNLAASFENMKTALGASLLEPLSALMGALMPIIDLIGKVLTPVFKILGDVVTMLSPVFPPLIEAFTTIVQAITPILDVLMKLIKPLLIPLVSVFKLITAIIKPFIPLIELLANVLGAVLTPIFLGLSIAIDLVIKGFIWLFDSLSNIPFVGDAFKGISASLKEFQKGTDDATNSLLGVTDTHNAMTKQLSKKLPAPDISATNVALDKVVKKSKAAADKINKYLSDALNIQKSILDSANITELFTNTSKQVVESIVYVDGKYKSVVRSVGGSTKDLGKSFSDVFTRIKKFGNQITRLDSLGLDSGLLQQIVSAGPEAGSAIASAILSSGQDGIDGLNDTYKDIKKVSGDIGATVGATMQTTGTEIGNGLIDGIKATADKLNTTATDMGNSFSSSFKNAVDANSPAATTITSLTSTKKKPDTKADFSKFTYNNAKPLTDAQYTFNAMSDIFKPKKEKFKGTPYALTPKYEPFKNYEFSANQIKNPYNKDSQNMAYNYFEQRRLAAINYNLTVTLPYGASDVAIGQMLIEKLKAYERSAGTGWRK
jgi:hypothetical protein